MFYLKNVPTIERVIRVLAGIALSIGAFFLTGSALWVGAAVATGIFLVMTGFIGFCPMCALVGRRLDKR